MGETMYDFAVGQTNPETFPTEAFAAAATRAIQREHHAYNQYPGLKGHEGLRKLMAIRESEREGVAIDPDNIALTNGSMQAVTLAGQAFMRSKGDCVITEAFTYSGTISAYKGIGLKLLGIDMDEQGMRIDALCAGIEAQLRLGAKPKFIYTLTRYQNPTGTCMPLERRRELIDVSTQYDIPIVEDNCYGDVHFDGPIAPSLFAMDDAAQHVYIGSLSKIFAPGVRLGYLYAKEPLYTSIVSQRFDAGANYFAASVLAEFYKDGIAPHSEATIPALKRKRDLLLAALGETLSDVCVWSKPQGGLFVWVRVPSDTDMAKLTNIANAHQFYFAPGADFHFDQKEQPYLRLAFGHVPDALIEPGIHILASAIAQARTSNAPRRFEGLFD